MTQWHNVTGKPLSSQEWLLTHHFAKIDSRKNFVSKLLSFNPKKIVDLGCGIGLWLELLNEMAPLDCELIGLDTDTLALDEAKRRSQNWSRSVDFINTDFTNELSIPDADMYLAFNIFPYIFDAENFLRKLYSKVGNQKILVIRQYDGGMLRFGPMKQSYRMDLDIALFNSVNGNDSFHHYDMDRVFELLNQSDFKQKDMNFELFQAFSPYSNEFIKYLSKTIEWNMLYVNEPVRNDLKKWLENYLLSSTQDKNSYFIGIDLVAILA